MKEINQDKENSKLFFKLSLAQWSLHRSLFAKEMDHLDFATKSRSLGFEGVEYVSQFFEKKVKDMSYLNEMNLRANDEGQQNVLIMVDYEGGLANEDKSKRLIAIENHYKWIDAADHLGCHAIRVNLAEGVNEDEALKSGLESLNALLDFAKGSNINILVENHGGLSSNGNWMAQLFSKIENNNCGTLVDFGNFCIKKGNDDNCVEEYDRYKGVQELLPFAKGVSSKSYAFDEDGYETTIDYSRMMKMVKEVGYNGFVGVEFEGSDIPEEEGIKATRDLLIRLGKTIS